MGAILNLKNSTRYSNISEMQVLAGVSRDAESQREVWWTGVIEERMRKYEKNRVSPSIMLTGGGGLSGGG